MVMWELDTADLVPEEPRVLVDPTIEAFCEVKSRTARGTTPPPVGSGRLSRELIERYLLENAETTGDDDP